MNSSRVATPAAAHHIGLRLPSGRFSCLSGGRCCQRWLSSSRWLACTQARSPRCTYASCGLDPVPSPIVLDSQEIDSAAPTLAPLPLLKADKSVLASPLRANYPRACVAFCEAPYLTRCIDDSLLVSQSREDFGSVNRPDPSIVKSDLDVVSGHGLVEDSLLFISIVNSAEARHLTINSCKKPARLKATSMSRIAPWRSL